MAKRGLGTHFLKQWREYRGLSLRKLAGMMEGEPGVALTSHANIGRIENFQQPYSQEILEAAAEALGCTVIDILTVDPTTAGADIAGPAAKLRAAMLAYGVDRSQVELAIGVLGNFVPKEVGAQPEYSPSRDRSAPASPRRAKAPSE